MGLSLDPKPIPNEVTDTVAEMRSTPYARALVTHWNQNHIDRVTQVINDIGAAKWLKVNPFTKLEFTEELLLDGVRVNGTYSFDTQVVQVATTRDREDFGKDFV